MERVYILAADESLVRFHDSTSTAHAGDGFVLERFADAVQHEPCAFLGDAQGAVQLPRTDSILTIGEHPDSGHPFVESKGGVFEDRSYLDGELFLAALAKPQQAGLDERVFIMSATRAGDNPIWPAKVHGVYKRPLRIGEGFCGFVICVKYIVADSI